MGVCSLHIYLFKLYIVFTVSQFNVLEICRVSISLLIPLLPQLIFFFIFNYVKQFNLPSTFLPHSDLNCFFVRKVIKRRDIKSCCQSILFISLNISLNIKCVDASWHLHSSDTTPLGCCFWSQSVYIGILK